MHFIPVSMGKWKDIAKRQTWVHGNMVPSTWITDTPSFYSKCKGSKFRILRSRVYPQSICFRQVSWLEWNPWTSRCWFLQTFAIMYFLFIPRTRFGKAGTYERKRWQAIEGCTKTLQIQLGATRSQETSLEGQRASTCQKSTTHDE